ncbi:MULTISPECIES: M16 family metallopeptidase [Pseudomonas]|jgi:zinc protease|uniref:Insulinase family protein n=1 Tax=Pseudomonas gingeri TaxID=117681 RepID=A0A7Y7WIL5_9PSED|nr:MULTISPECIES: pitrilysin family protein [Pseudomonas]MCU1741361.1 insulinase family protein [Pseudomonas sp. 20S_6.2_Bac1]NWB50042.1 insulinase family protein [Pseudomonas gingeri]
MNKTHPVLSNALLALLATLAIPGPMASAGAERSTVNPLQSLSEVQHLAPTPTTRVIRGWKTLSGTKVLFVETHGLPLLDVAVSFAAGSRYDGEQPGLAAMALSLLNEGSEGKDVDTILSAFDSLGVKIGNGIDRDHGYFTLRSLSDETIRTPALQLLSEVLSKPSFTRDAIRRVKSEILDRQMRQDAAFDTWVNHRFQPPLYPRHPYAQPLYGTRESIGKITTDQLRDFHNKAYSAGNAIIVLVGDLSLEQAQSISVKLSDALPKGPALPPTANPRPEDSLVGTTHIERSSTLVHLDFAQIAAPRNHPDYVALYVASLIFGGGFDSRLMKVLREQHGVTYSAEAQLKNWQARGPFHINLSTPPEYREAVIRRVKRMFEQLLKDGPTEQELQNIKLSLRGDMALNGASNADILQALLVIARHDLPLSLTDYAEQAQQLTREMIKAALNAHFDANSWVVTSTGPSVAQQALPDLQVQGPTCLPHALPPG